MVLNLGCARDPLWTGKSDGLTVNGAIKSKFVAHLEGLLHLFGACIPHRLDLVRRSLLECMLCAIAKRLYQPFTSLLGSGKSKAKGCTG